MPLAHWDPVRELLALQQRMGRLIDEALSQSRSAAGISSNSTWSPPVDLYESERNLVLKAELPEVEQDAIELRIDKNRITVRGERRLKEPTSHKFHRMERAFGPFTRSFTLPISIDPDRVKAEFKRGILKVTMPKRVDERSKQVPISS
ncbi:MAG: Hsp20/alpha crystallin family protein [Acidobacteriota bacterium]